MTQSVFYIPHSTLDKNILVAKSIKMKHLFEKSRNSSIKSDEEAQSIQTNFLLNVVQVHASHRKISNIHGSNRVFVLNLTHEDGTKSIGRENRHRSKIEG